MNTALRTFLLFIAVLFSGNALQAQITAGFTFSPQNGCAPQVVQFTNTSTGSITSYSWTFGNSTGSILQNPSTSYTSPGTYQVHLTVTGSGGTKTATGTVIIYPPPIVSFTFSPSSGCTPLPVSFTASVTPGVAGPVTYYWDFGDGFTSTSSSPTHSFASAGTYTPKVTITNSKGCATTYVSTNTITAFPKPTVNFSASPNLYCSVPATASFSSTVTGSSPFTYLWDFGDGGSATSGSPANIYNSVGMFTVKLFVSDANGCKDTIIKPNYIVTQNATASFTGPTSICAGRAYGGLSSPAATFTNTTPGATPAKTFWNYGDGNNDTGAAASHAYTTAGTYTISMSTEVGGCTYTTTRQITVNPNPTSIAFTYAPFPNCPTPATMHFSATGASGYEWIWKSGGSSLLNNPTHIYPTDPYIDTVTLIGTSAYGCKDTIKGPVYITDMRFAYLGAIKGCVPLTIGDSMILKSSVTSNGLYPGFPGIVTSYLWDFGDGSPPSTAVHPPHTYTSVGTYNRVLTITTGNGCTKTDTVQIHVGLKYKPSFTFHPDTVCPKVPVYFINTTPVIPSSHLSFTWDVGQSYSMINGRDAVASYFRPGTYDVILYADSNGCEDSAKCIGCLIVRPSNANFTDSVYCSPNSLTVAMKDSSIGATSYNWDFGDGSTSTLASPVHTYATQGSYNISLITNNSTYGCRDTMIVPVTVNKPVLSFTTPDTTLCPGDTLKLYPSYSGIGQVIYTYWSVDTVNTDYDTLRIPAVPVYGAGYVMAAYNGATNKHGLQRPIGYHTVSLKVITLNPGFGTCVDTFTRKNYVIVSHPVAGFSGNPLIACTPSPVTFIDTSHYTTGTAGAGRFWTFGDGDTATALSSNTVHTYLTSGFYTVTLKVTDWNGCTDSITKFRYIESRKPSSWFQVLNPNVCVGASVIFTNISAGSSALGAKWYFGDGDSSTAFFGVTHAYRTAGAFIVRLIVYDSTGCRDTMAQVITATKPIAAFTLSDTLAVCPPLIVSFNSTSTNAISYHWDFRNGGTASFQTPVSTFSTPGVYNVILAVRDANGCVDTARANVRVLGYAGAFSYTPLKGCHPMTVSFTSNINNIPGIVWDFADGTTTKGIGLTSSHTYMTPGAYVPKLIFSDNTGCAASSIGVDTIKVDGVIAGFKVPAPCEKTPVILLDSSYSYFSAMKDWHWDFGGSGIATGNPVTHTFGAAGIYPITFIATNEQGCKDTVTQNITIYKLPKIVAMNDTAVCVPDGITMFATGGASYAWSPPNFLSCTSCPNPIASPTIPTSYVVTGTDSVGCVNKDTVRIGIQFKTSFVTSASGEICLGEHFQLSAKGATTYSWTPTESLDSPNVANPIATPKINTTYIVTGQEGSCLLDTHIVRVTVRPLPLIDAGGDVKVIAGHETILQASGSGISRVEWTKDSTLSCLTCFAPTATPRVTTVYYVTAYNDYGCTSTDSVKVIVLCDGSQLFIPNTFSPNGDGNNDYFFPRGVGIDQLNSFRIYSRWGELLFERTNSAINDEHAGWNGTFAGRILNPDVYVYIIEAGCGAGEAVKFKGDVTLMR